MSMAVVGGHAGAGIVVEVGEGVTDVAEGDPVVLSFIPACGRCGPCVRGMSNLCELGMHLLKGPQLDGTHRFHARGHDVGQMCLLGTFSEYTVVPTASVVKVDESVPIYRRTVHRIVARVGINAVQAARIVGARHIVALDPIEYKRTRAMEFGATHTAATLEEAAALVIGLTRGQKADVCVVTTDVAEGAYVGQALSLVGKRGRVVMTAMAHPTDTQVNLSLVDLTLFEKQVRGSLFGSSNPRSDIFRMLELYDSGQLKLDELITREYTLSDINSGYDDLRSGLNLRGLIRF